MTTPILFDAVGWAVIHSLWQGLLIGGVVLLVLHASRTRSASLRHAASFLGLLAMLVAFAATTTLLLVNGTDPVPHVVASTAASDHVETVTPTTGMTTAPRGIATAPDLLLVDEPTAQLDQRTSAVVSDTLSRIATDGVIIVVATHDARTRDACTDLIDLGAPT